MRTHRGFTFLELMLSLVIVSIVAGAVIASWRAADTARRSIMNGVEPLRQASTAIEFLRRDLESALPPSGYLTYEFIGSQNTLIPDADDVKFCAAVDGPRGIQPPADIRLIEYTLVADGTSNALVRYVTSNLLPQTGQEDSIVPDQEVICRNVRSFHLEYSDGIDRSTTWDSTQDASALGQQQSQMLPAAVIVTIVLEPATSSGEPTQLQRVISLPCITPATQPSSTTGTTP